LPTGANAVCHHLRRRPRAQSSKSKLSFGWFMFPSWLNLGLFRPAAAASGLPARLATLVVHFGPGSTNIHKSLIAKIRQMQPFSPSGVPSQERKQDPVDGGRSGGACAWCQDSTCRLRHAFTSWSSAGWSLAGPGLHLEPIPLMDHEGNVSMRSSFGVLSVTLGDGRTTTDTGRTE
jgi:hypothetical protein